MPRQRAVSVENNFTGGLKTEFTGLNFPENAATDTDNCVFTRIGRAIRRLGIDFESNTVQVSTDRTDNAVSSFKWTNAGGNGTSTLIAVQVGSDVLFYKAHEATVSAPLSSKFLLSSVDLSTFIPSGGSFDSSLECQYAAGNGLLFIFHPSTEPIVVTYSGTAVDGGAAITVKIRDFQGIAEPGVPDNFRPPSLSDNHSYNIQNQGWLNSPSWTATSTTSNDTTTGSHTWTVQAGLTATPGQSVAIVASGGFISPVNLTGVVSAYAGTTLTINVSSSSFPSGFNIATSWTFALVGTGKVTTFQAAVGLYPSNSDVWWYFKDTSDVFNPAVTAGNVTLAIAPAPKGSFILEAFNQDRASVSGIAGLSAVTSGGVRPLTGTWFQGRVWYAGVNAAGFTESIYFSQIVERPEQIGYCYQNNDPTSETLFDLLPSDGGVVRIQGCSIIYKLFPIQNGLLVFAANGIWFITGSQGIGFTANDYTVTKISSVQSISGSSFVDVNGYPIWWNEEGIYGIVSGQAGLEVKSLSFSTISSFYEDIPLTCKKVAKGAYNPLTYILQWTYKSTEPSDITDRYEFDRILNFDTTTQAFYPWTISGISTSPKVNGVIYVEGVGGTDTPTPILKYITTIDNGAGGHLINFAEENNTDYQDWQATGAPQDFDSFFITGYKLHGQTQRKWQPTYVYVFSTNEQDTSYRIQGIWNFANTGNSGKFSSIQLATINVDNFDKIYRRHKIRGSGVSLQFKVLSVSGEPFDIMGWSIFETSNAGV